MGGRAFQIPTGCRPITPSATQPTLRRLGRANAKPNTTSPPLPISPDRHYPHLSTGVTHVSRQRFPTSVDRHYPYLSTERRHTARPTPTGRRQLTTRRSRGPQPAALLSERVEILQRSLLLPTKRKNTSRPSRPDKKPRLQFLWCPVGRRLASVQSERKSKGGPNGPDETSEAVPGARRRPDCSAASCRPAGRRENVNQTSLVPLQASQHAITTNKNPRQPQKPTGVIHLLQYNGKPISAANALNTRQPA